MAFNYNHITLVGRLSKDPETRMHGNVRKVSFTLAVDRPYRREDGTCETDFIPVVLWGKLAEVAEKHLRKGRPTLVEGRLQVRDYESDSVRKWITEVVGENFQILESLANK
jgi:single-strand DNA-binding protein